MWAKEWQMKFNADKCRPKVVQVCSKDSKQTPLFIRARYWKKETGYSKLRKRLECLVRYLHVPEWCTDKRPPDKRPLIMPTPNKKPLGQKATRTLMKFIMNFVRHKELRKVPVILASAQSDVFAAEYRSDILPACIAE